MMRKSKNPHLRLEPTDGSGTQDEAVLAWAKAPGIAAEGTRAVSISPDGVLFVRTESEDLAAYFRRSSVTLLRRLNQGRTGQMITGIRWIVGPLDPTDGPDEAA